jgi:hypothetical protein
MIKDNSNKYNNQLTDLERRITLDRGEERLAYKKYKNNNVLSGEIHQTNVAIADRVFTRFGDGYDTEQLYDAYMKSKKNN